MLIHPLNESHPSESSAGNSASNPRLVAEIASAFIPSSNVHETTANSEGPTPALSTNAECTLPQKVYHEDYDDSRLNSPEVNAEPDRGLPDLPAYKEHSGRSEPPNVVTPPRITFPAKPQLIDTSTAAPTSGVGVHGTTAATSSGARRPILPWLERKSPLVSRPTDRPAAAPSSGISIHGTTSTNHFDKRRILAPSPGTTSSRTSHRPDTAVRSFKRAPDGVEIIEVDAWTARPHAGARSSNRIPGDAEIFDVEGWEARPCMQVTHPPSDLSVQASSRTLSKSEQIAVDSLASNSQSRDTPQGLSGSRTGSNARSEIGNSFPESQIETWLSMEIKTALQNKIDDQLGAALLCAFANDCHKRDEIRKGKQRKDEAPVSPLFPSIENNCSVECGCSDENAANVEYIYNVRAGTQTCYGNELKALKAHPGNAVWALAESRLGFVNDPRKWETACNHCSSEQREQTIPLEEAAVDDKKNQSEGAAPYNPDLYTTTSSMRELRVKPHKSLAEIELMAMSPNLSSPPPSFQAPSSGSNNKGKQKANGDGNSNQSQPTPPLASGHATSSRSRNRGTREANGDINKNTSETQARPPQPPPPPTRSSRRNHRPPTPQLQVSPAPPAPATSSSRRSRRHAPSTPGNTFDRIDAITLEQIRAVYSSKTREANNEDDEQGKRAWKKEKKNVSWDSKVDAKVSSKRQASEAVDDVDGGCRRVARARRKIVSNSSNGANESGASQKSQRSAAAGTLAAGSGTASSGTGSNLIVPDVVAAHEPEPVTHSTSHVTTPRGERSSDRPGRLILHVAAEANPEHPDHEAYLARGQMSRKRGKE